MMTRTSRITAHAALSLAILIMAFGCKSSNSDPDPALLTSLQGSWKITGLSVNPGFTYAGVTVTNLSSALPVLGEDCLKDAVFTFNSNGTISNNIDTQPSCANATYTKRIVGSFFGPSTTYSETATQATLTTGGVPLTGDKVFTATSATFTAKLPTDPNNNPVTTTYTLVLTKQ